LCATTKKPDRSRALKFRPKPVVIRPHP
jgi:hypothetical protein